MSCLGAHLGCTIGVEVLGNWMKREILVQRDPIGSLKTGGTNPRCGERPWSK